VPERRVTWRDHACVASARFGCDLAVALDDDDLVTVFLRLIDGGDADTRHRQVKRALN
jgi:hypothetical protein